MARPLLRSRRLTGRTRAAYFGNSFAIAIDDIMVETPAVLSSNCHTLNRFSTVPRLFTLLPPLCPVSAQRGDICRSLRHACGTPRRC